MKILIVTGMSGAGKSTALRRLEDMGYFCVDNLPLALLKPFTALALAPDGEYERVALGLDVRSIRAAADVQILSDIFHQNRAVYEMLFLDCQDQDLIRRFKETRREHPLSRGGRIMEGIRAERELLSPLKEQADDLLDTSGLLVRDLAGRIDQIFSAEQGAASSMKVTVLSFGFKRGIPTDADLVFDVRFLPNPYYSEQLRLLTGLDSRVQEYVLQGGSALDFEDRWFSLLSFVLPQYIKEGKKQLVIAVGCTGGQHRSVTMAERLYRHLQKENLYEVAICHRELERI